LNSTAPSLSPVRVRDARGAILDLILGRLGLRPTIETFDERKTIQKVVFIVQRAGIPVGYSYRWHISGPYSSELARVYYSIATNPDGYAQQAAGLVLKPEIEKGLQAVRDALGNEIKDPELLEALASALYLRTRDLATLTKVKPKIPHDKWQLAFEKMNVLKWDK
jgi:uncharacterized protein YwgA